MIWIINNIIKDHNKNDKNDDHTNLVLTIVFDKP